LAKPEEEPPNNTSIPVNGDLLRTVFAAVSLEDDETLGRS
jgi:hypothetical protein